jgi:hypothetical protein
VRRVRSVCRNARPIPSTCRKTRTGAYQRMLGSMVKLILVLLAKTPPQFAVGRDKCSTSGAKYRFVVVQYARITESKTSASWATEFCSLVEAGSNLLMEIYDLVYRHGALDSVGLESITVPKDGSLIAYFRCKQASAGEKHRPRFKFVL